MTGKGALAALMIMSAAAPAWADGQCSLSKVTSLDLGIDGSGGADVPITIAGHKLTLLVDTGGVVSMLSTDTVKSLGLRAEPMARVRFEMYGGRVIDHFVNDIALGQLTTPQLKFLIMPYGLPDGIDGTLSPDIMRNYDVDFDFAASKMNFFSQDHCPGKVVYWSRAQIARIPVKLDMWGHLKVPLKLDGAALIADIDTGSSRSMMSLETAEDKFGFKSDDPRLTPAEPNSGEAHAYVYPFKTLSLEGVHVSNPDIVLVSDRDSHIGRRGPPLILGMGILRQLHLYIAYGERNLYVTAADANEKTPAAQPATATAAPEEPPSFPVSLHCTSPAVDGQFTEDGPPGFVTAKIVFSVYSEPDSGAVRVTRANGAVCTVRAKLGTVIASATVNIDSSGPNAPAARELLKHVEIEQEMTDKNAHPAERAYVFTVKATDGTRGKLMLDFPVCYR